MTSYAYKFPPGDHHLPVGDPHIYDPLKVDNHYRLEWDLVEEREHTTKHQVRIFDQGGDEGWEKFMDLKRTIEEARGVGMVENVSWSHREVVVKDWELGAPTLPPTLTRED